MHVNWQEFLAYDEAVGSCLRWLVDSYSGVRHAKIQSHAGTEAGSVSKRGYFVVGLNGKLHKAHKIIWELHNGSVPHGMIVDHEDGNKLNNTIGNLKLKTQKLNCRNRGKASNNTSGVTGVSLFEVSGRTYWQAQWRSEEGKAVSKYFNVGKMGYNEAFEAACAAREAAIKSLEGYTDRHGQ